VAKKVTDSLDTLTLNFMETSRMANHLTSAILTAVVLFSGALSCSEKEIQISTTGNKGYTEKPIHSFKAMDANGEWIDAEIDDNDRNINFRFRAHTSLEEVNCVLDVDPEWGSLIFPESREFVLNLNAAQVITVNDGVDDIRYRVTGEIQEPLRKVSLTAAGETVEVSSISSRIVARFDATRSRSALEHVKVALTMEKDLVLLSPENLDDVDLNGKDVSIHLYDKKTRHEKVYTLSAFPGAAIATGPGNWEDVSVSWSAAHSVALPDHISIYKTTSLHGSAGRTGWAIVVDGGKVGGKLLAKADVEAGRSKVSLVLKDHPDYMVFIPYQGPGMWRTSANGENTYISPVVWRDGSFARSITFGTRPSLGIKDGKAEIRFAYNIGDVLYSFNGPKEEPKAEDGTPWDADLAAGGCFMLVQNGENLLGGEDSRTLSTYRSLWVPYPETHTFITPNWSNYQPLDTYLTQRGGRVAMGCTAEGSLVIFQTEMLVNTHAQYQWTSTADSGSTVNEVARELVQMGCTSAALWEENYWDIVLMQDGGAYNEGNLYGAEFFHHQRRHYLDASGHTPGSLYDSEYENLYVLMIK